MGQGDIKLFPLWGPGLGGPLCLLFLCASSLSGLVIGAIYLALTHQDKNIPIPFGPFLCFSGFLTILYGKCCLTLLMQWFRWVFPLNSKEMM